MTKHSKVEQLEAELSSLKNELNRVKANCFWDNVSKIISPAIKWGALAFIAVQGTTAIGYLSGKTTDATIDLKASAIFNPDEACANWPYWIAALSAVLCATAISYGFNQRTLRKNTIENLAGYKEKYEKMIDPNRSTSGLLGDGSTHPKDR
ncbi:hypothetical protein KEF85_01565 [Methylomonas paludis]|uniref:Uncharacterized protein n=1 Tax=Methylomonas paludis TaxID=1173101 RepID=A0A975MNS8_9GAMM|nr:hypothetical protein [Methylomonas paludis]QWF71212.1 hypothetical protein KEF85_01565 [Methylomonas paludis]